MKDYIKYKNAVTFITLNVYNTTYNHSSLMIYHVFGFKTLKQVMKGFTKWQRDQPFELVDRPDLQKELDNE